ncbi:hypothetical protein [Microcoleus sp. FACHB-68]|uniref:hypothetical protein n=1 Tax=Microcoleus sp. FACHB-68 TaxID=2692826 RepID=UPI0016835652|nr:hypothetical protein [Microcoleus sp. FACHB-68]MBD1937331.1 hypothetical protein [Microcoleus sp. FACHB-68]
MLREMCWLPTIGASGEKILHLRTAASDPWRPYKAFPQFAVPDYQVPGGSKGWATYQKLRSAGWNLVATAQAQSSSVGEQLKSA